MRGKGAKKFLYVVGCSWSTKGGNPYRGARKSREEKIESEDKLKWQRILSDKLNLELIETTVEAGSGSLPLEKMPSYAIKIISDTIKPSKIYNKFLKSKVPVIGYIKENSFRIDLKAIPEDQIKVLIISIKECLI